MKKQRLLNTYVSNVNMDEALHEISRQIEDNQKSYIVALNVDVVVKIEKDPYLQDIMNQADLSLVDGKPLVWIAKWHKRPVKEKISGSDLVPELCKIAAEKGYTIFIIGGKKGVAEKAKANLEKELPRIKIVGTYAPSIGFEKDEIELEKINKIITNSHPDILIACLGCPKQEKWIFENYQKYDAVVSICAGATVDFLSGNVNRAPKWMADHGFEWVYRLLQEPKRLYKRYLIDDMKIIEIVWKYRRSV